MSSWNHIDSHEFYPKVKSQFSFPSVQPLPKVDPEKQRNSEYVYRFAGLAVGLASVVSEHILSHPCITLRRQCQVHNTSTKTHILPLTLFPLIFNIQRHQSMTSLWKGLGSSLMVKGIMVASEAAIHEATGLPRECNKKSKILHHVLLKGLALVIVTPFYAASLVETVQSEIASEKPGVFDSIFEGLARLASLGSSTPTRLLPIWKLIPPTVCYGLLHYIISSIAKYRVSSSMRAGFANKSPEEREEDGLYEMYYPELLATFTGNLLADTILYPFETILHRLFLQGTRTIIDNTDTGLEVVPIMTRYEGVVDCYSTVVDDEGVSGLYKGFGALLIQYGLHIAILKLTRSIFEIVSHNSSRRNVEQIEFQDEFNPNPLHEHRMSFEPSLNYSNRDMPPYNLAHRDRFASSPRQRI